MRSTTCGVVVSFSDPCARSGAARGKNAPVVTLRGTKSGLRSRSPPGAGLLPAGGVPISIHESAMLEYYRIFYGSACFKSEVESNL